MGHTHEARLRDANCANVTKIIAYTIVAISLIAASGCKHIVPPSAPATPTPAPYATGDYPEYGYAPDLSWVAGELFVGLRGPLCTYVLFSNGRGAAWGGTFALTAAPGVLDGLRSGDHVVVHGALTTATLRGCDARQFNVTRAELH
jgi:hypothetical protein